MIQFIAKKIGYFFYYFGGATPFKQFGLWLYKLSLYILVLIVKKDKRIKAVYTVTDLKSREFIVGKSDIDILIVISSMDVKSEINFNLYFHKLEKKILAIFPFFGSVFDDHLYVFEDNFVLFQKNRRRYIERRGKHIKNWQLVYGVECRTDYGDDETELDGYFIRFCYEQVLLAVYLGALRGKIDFRMLYKYSFHIMRMFFIFVIKREARDLMEYKHFLSGYGLDSNFLAAFFDLPDKKFITDDTFAIKTVHVVIGLLEQMAEVDKSKPEDFLDFEIIEDHDFKVKVMPEIDDFINCLDKIGLKSIYVSNILHLESYFLYLIVDNISEYSIFKKQFEDIFNCLKFLKTLDKKISIKLRSRMWTMAPDIFPLFITNKLMNYTKFMDYGIIMESINFSASAVKLYGDTVCPIISKQQVRQPDYFLHYDMHNLRVDASNYNQQLEKLKSCYVMRHRLLVEKNKLYLTNVANGYYNYFGGLNIDNSKEKDWYGFMRCYIKKSIIE